MTLGLVVDNREETVRPALPDAEMQADLKPSDLLAHIWRRKLMVVALTVILSVVAFFVISGMEPTYTARTTLMFDPRLLPSEADAGTDPGRDGAIIEGEIQIILSRGLAGRVIDDLALMADPEFNRALDPTITLRDRVGLGVDWIRSWLPGGAGDDAAAVEPPPTEAYLRDRVVDRVLDGLSAYQVGDSRVIALAFTASEPDKAAAIANTYADLYITQRLDARLEAMRATAAWMAERLAELRDQAEASERRLADHTSELIDIGDRDPATIDGELEMLSGRITELRSQATGLRARYNQIQNLYQGQGARAAAAAVGSDVVDDIRGQLALLEQQRAELAAELDVRHPTMVNVRLQIDVLSGELNAIVSATIESLRIEVATVENELTGLVADQESLLQIRRAVDRGEAQLRVMEREAEANRGLLEALLNREEEVQALALGNQEAYVISEASLPVSADGPGRTMLMLAAMMAAGMVAVSAAIAVEMLSGTFNTADEVERMLGLRVVGILPRRGGLGIGRRLTLARAAARTATPLNTALRGVLAAVETMRGSRKPGLVLLVTSAQDRDGKTTISLMLATLMASLGQRPVVIDADFQTGGAGRAMDAGAAAGLSDALAGRVSPEQALSVSSRHGFAIMPAGRTANQEMRLGTGTMAEVIRRLRLEYDAVIIDAPEGTRPEARLLADHVDAQVLVLRWRRSLRRRARRAVAFQSEAAAPLAAVIVGMPAAKVA